MQPQSTEVRLRPVEEADLPILFEFELDVDANRMVAFTSAGGPERGAFMGHWAKLLANHLIGKRTILADGEVAGSIVSFDFDGELNVGYRLGREFWSRGIATKGLALFLEDTVTRPIYGRVVADNVASRRVLEKCGFVLVRSERSHSEARDAEVDELVLRLDL